MEEYERQYLSNLEARVRAGCALPTRIVHRSSVLMSGILGFIVLHSPWSPYGGDKDWWEARLYSRIN